MSGIFYLGNRCLCIGQVTHYTPGAKSCPDCLQVASVYVPCYQMPEINSPGVVPISTYNDYKVCTEGKEIKIINTPLGVTASVDQDNNIEFQFDSYAANPGEILVIHYKVYCKQNGMSANGYIHLCHPVDPD